MGIMVITGILQEFQKKLKKIVFFVDDFKK